MIALQPFMVVFRLLHIVSGALWFGSAFLFIRFIGPSAAELGPAAGPMLQEIVKKRKVTKVITTLAVTTVLAGWILWIRDGLELSDLLGVSFGTWVGNRAGLVLMIGGIIATFAALEGVFLIGPTVERLVDLGGRIASGGGPPSAELQADLGKQSRSLEQHGKIHLVLLLLAVTAMATARFW